jgi:hypothetical protein
MIFLLAAPAGGAAAGGRDAAIALPPRDTVIESPSAGSARISAAADTERYSLGGGSGGGETVAIAVTAACQEACNAADPQQIADTLGSFLHGPEMELLTVQLDTPAQIEFDCGYGAQACYYDSEDKIVLNGNDGYSPDGAGREYVLAHEYGHHVARHRESPAPFPAAIDWGTARWSSYENVCRRSRAGALFPGNEGLHYFRDPGEAFAETFARLRFPDSGVAWRWLPALEPDANALEAVREDALHPWLGRSVLSLRGRMPPRRDGAAVRLFGTPLDGRVSLRPVSRHPYALRLLNPAGRVLRTSRHDLSFRHQVNYTVCGQSRLRVAIRSSRRAGGAFKLQIQRP